MRNGIGLGVVPGIMLLAVLGLASEASAQISPDWTRCINEGNAFSGDVVIAGCTAVINSRRERGNNLAIAHNNRGLAYGAKGDGDRALADYAKAIEINPQNANAYWNRGNAYRAMGDADRAIADYTKVIEINPKFAATYTNRGLAYDLKGDLDRALADYTKAIEIDPQNANAYSSRGGIYTNIKDLDRALTDYTKAIEIDPNYAADYYNRGVVYAAKGDLDRALTDYTKAIEIDPKFGRAYYSRGMAYRTKGDTARASTDLSEAVRLDPSLSSVMIFFDYESSSLGQSAQKLIDDVVELFKSTHAKEVRIVAHTDSAEPDSEALSMSRAKTLHASLVAKGVPDNLIAIQGLGNTSPMVPTTQGTKEPLNRRAEVTIVP